jgi:hypothetical protein
VLTFTADKKTLQKKSFLGKDQPKEVLHKIFIVIPKKKNYKCFKASGNHSNTPMASFVERLILTNACLAEYKRSNILELIAG